MGSGAEGHMERENRRERARRRWKHFKKMHSGAGGVLLGECVCMRVCVSACVSVCDRARLCQGQMKPAVGCNNDRRAPC